MKSQRLYKLVLAALFAAMSFVSILVVHIPMPGFGYINPGDAFGLTAGILLGPVYGGLAAGIGSALSDVILGYTVYVPATFVIKFISAVAAYYISKWVLSNYRLISVSISTIIGEAIMVAGYFFYEWIIYDKGVAVASILYNTIQGLGSAVIAIIIIMALYKSKVLERINLK